MNFIILSKDDPLKFVYWKKRLRDVREQLKADALEKLKMSCPTLFALGWFKENGPKDEATLKEELEELKKENDSLAEKNTETSKQRVRERQVGDDLFISL